MIRFYQNTSEPSSPYSLIVIVATIDRPLTTWSPIRRREIADVEYVEQAAENYESGA
jgi:hypothetical protein